MGAFIHSAVGLITSGCVQDKPTDFYFQPIATNFASNETLYSLVQLTLDEAGTQCATASSSPPATVFSIAACEPNNKLQQFWLQGVRTPSGTEARVTDMRYDPFSTSPGSTPSSDFVMEHDPDSQLLRSVDASQRQTSQTLGLAGVLGWAES